MNLQKTLIATIVGAIVMFLAGYLIWGIILEPIQKSHITSYLGFERAEPNYILMFLSMLAAALLITIIFQRWAGIKTAVTGAKAGAIIGILIGLHFDLMTLAMTNWYDTFVVITNALGNIAWGAIGGAVIGFILGRE